MLTGRMLTTGRRRFCIALTCLLLAASATLAAQEKLIPFEQNDLWGYKDASGRVVIKPQYYVAEKFSSEGLAAVADDTSWAYIDPKGKVIIRPFVFDNGPDEFREELARFVVDHKFGFFNRKGEVVIPPQFVFAAPFYEGRAAVCMECVEHWHGEHSFMAGGKWGYIDKQGTIVIPLQFENARNFENGRAEVKLQDKWISIDTAGTVKDGP